MGQEPLRAGFGHGGGDSLRAADSLTGSLGLLSTEALLAADFAEQNRDLRSASDFDRVADSASSLKLDVHRRVLRVLKVGGPGAEFRAERELQGLGRSQEELGLLIQRLPAGSLRSAESVRRDWRQLEDSFRGPGPGPGGEISATCTGRSGGNFFNPKSHVECTIVGHGASAYEVTFFNDRGAQANAQGPLDPRQRSQAIVSEKVQVGWTPSFVVTVIDRGGNRVKVAEGRCGGSPF